MKALVIVDIQNDFMPGGPLEVPQGDKVVPMINNLQKYYDLVVATQDWHPANHISFASNHPGKKPFDEIKINGMIQTLWPDHCVQGTKGAELYPELDTRNIAAIFRKGMDPGIDSYSGFYDNDHITGTGLSVYLKDKGVSEVHFCGLAGDICVYYTIIDSINEGFISTLIEAATRPLDQNIYNKQKDELKTLDVRIICG